MEPDETRIAQETALLADRCDITEEITRLRSHLNQFRNFLNTNEPIGHLWLPSCFETKYRLEVLAG